MSQLAIGLVCTPFHSVSAKLQPFYEHPRIATSFLLSRSIGFVQFFNSICQISPFCICKHHQFDTLTLLTRECNGFVQFFDSICQISLVCICEHHQLAILTLPTRECNVFVNVICKISMSVFASCALYNWSTQQGFSLI